VVGYSSNSEVTYEQEADPLFYDLWDGFCQYESSSCAPRSYLQSTSLHHVHMEGVFVDKGRGFC